MGKKKAGLQVERQTFLQQRLELIKERHRLLFLQGRVFVGLAGRAHEVVTVTKMSDENDDSFYDEEEEELQELDQIIESEV